MTGAVRAPGGGLSLRARVVFGLAVIAAIAVGVAAAVTVTTERYLVSQLDERLAMFAGPPHPELHSAYDLLRAAAAVQTGSAPGSSSEGYDDAVGAVDAGADDAGADDAGADDAGGDDAGGDDENELGERPSEALSGVLLLDGTYIVLWSPNIYGSDDVDMPVFDVSELSTTERTYLTVGSAGEHGYRVLAEPLVDGWEITALSFEGTEDATKRLMAIELGGIAALVAGLALVGWWVIRLGVTPMRRLVDASSAIAAGDLDVRLDAVGGGREAAELGASLDAMVSRLTGALQERERSEAKLREFVADASHELRTPLTTVLGYAQLFRKGALTRKAEQADAWGRTEAEAARMKRLVEDMLELARYDAEPMLRLAPTDVTALVSEILADARRAHPEVQFALAEGAAVTARADADKLRQAVINVVGNAAQHGASAVTVAVSLSDGRARVEVTDNGPGMSAEVAERATERFVRGDSSRSRATGGAGLGLAITAAIVGAHGGELTLGSREGTGTTVALEWPA